MSRRLCMPCDRLVSERACPHCGADTDAVTGDVSPWVTIVDQELHGKRQHHKAALAAEHVRMDREAQARADQRIVAEREAAVTVRRIAERVR